MAVTAATSGGFSLGDAVLRFLAEAACGLLAGVAVALVVRVLRSVLRDPLLVNCISLATCLCRLPARRGDPRVRRAGRGGGRADGRAPDMPGFTTGASLLQASAVWRLVDFLLQGFVFLLIGQQLLPVVRGLKAYPASTIAGAVTLTLGVVLLLRPLWLLLAHAVAAGRAAYPPRRDRPGRRRPGTAAACAVRSSCSAGRAPGV